MVNKESGNEVFRGLEILKIIVSVCFIRVEIYNLRENKKALNKVCF